MSIQIVRYTRKGDDEEYMWPIDTDAPTGAEEVMLSLDAHIAALRALNAEAMEILGQARDLLRLYYSAETNDELLYSTDHVLRLIVALLQRTTSEGSQP